MISAEYTENCNTYYLSKLIKYGAEVSKEVEYFQNGSKIINSPIFFSLENTDSKGHFCIDVIKVLCENGANINVKENTNDPNLHRGVIYKCIFLKNMIALRYFIIDKKIELPKYVYERGLNYLTIEDVLLSDEFVFKHYEDNEKAKQDIIKYLNLNK